MQKIAKINFLAIGIIWIISFLSVFAGEIKANTSEPLPPPIDIKFTLENVPIEGGEAIVKLKVTPSEDMHADISCLLSEAVEPVKEGEVVVRPYVGRHPSAGQQSTIYAETVELWVGFLEAGITKEFTFRVIIPDKNRYELIAVVEALAKWGMKEQSLVIDIE